jgi:hypothetical protein
MFYDIVRDTQLGIPLLGRKMMCVELRSFIGVDIMGSSVQQVVAHLLRKCNSYFLL